MKKLLVVGCSHGSCINPDIAEQVIKFRHRWKPNTVVHLGDFVDTACYRTGAAGSKDEYADPEYDAQCGMTFMRELGVTHLTMGNHDMRPYELRNHPKQMVAKAAEIVCRRLDEYFKRQKIKVMMNYKITEHPYFTFGNFKFMHGFMYGENAIRDHAESFGNVVHAHTHRPGHATGRRSDDVEGFCVGTLSDIPNMDYAQRRRATLAWGHGLVFGEYNDTSAHLWLCNGKHGKLHFPL